MFEIINLFGLIQKDQHLRGSQVNPMIWVAQGKFYPTAFFVSIQCNIIYKSNSTLLFFNRQRMAQKMILQFPKKTKFSKIRKLSPLFNEFQRSPCNLTALTGTFNKKPTLNLRKDAFAICNGWTFFGKQNLSCATHWLLFAWTLSWVVNMWNCLVVWRSFPEN